MDFLPVLLGGDINVYGMALSFMEEYNIKSAVICKGLLKVCTNTALISEVVVEKRLEEDKYFVETLDEFRKTHFNKKLLLIPCGDNYAKLLSKHKEILKRYYYFNIVDYNLLLKLSIKEDFYKICESEGLLFPKTTIITKQNYLNKEISFPFPVIIKPSNSVMYWNSPFPHKKKVFLANDEKEYYDIVSAIYESKYTDNLIIQDYIPGDDTYMHVVNTYSNQNGKVVMLSIGNALLEEHTPEGIGSYAVIINKVDDELSKIIINFLNKIGYKGYANFDLKYDYRDKKYKLFEMNLRQGRSSYFVTASGFNLSKFIVDDVLFNKKQQLQINKNIVLYSIVPKYVIYKYINNKELLQKAKFLIKEGKLYGSYYSKMDSNYRRYINYLENQINYIRKYKKYYNNKSLKDKI